MVGVLVTSLGSAPSEPQEVASRRHPRPVVDSRGTPPTRRTRPDRGVRHTTRRYGARAPTVATGASSASLVGVAVRELVESRVVRAVVLLMAMGMGGFAGAPTVELPPRAGFSAPGRDGDGDGGGGGGGGGDGDDAPRPPAGPAASVDRDALVLVGVG